MKERGLHGADFGDVEGEAELELAPGKRSLTDQIGRSSRLISSEIGRSMRSDAIPVQRKAHAGAVQRIAKAQAWQTKPVQQKATVGDDVGSTARAGLAGTGGALPHLAAIQGAFGRHEVGDVRAHVGGAAAEASAAIGARAYATGNDVAFAAAPDLHTAAHEAAHVVQQRGGVRLAGGVGQAGDAYEQHADAVADLVVSGRSAESLLDTMAGGSSASRHGAGALQRKDEKAEELPVGVNMSVGSDGTILARAEWLRADPGFRTGDDGSYFPGASAEMLRALKTSGVLYWIDDAKIPKLATIVHADGKITPSIKYVRLHLLTSLYVLIGPPPSSDVMVMRQDDGLVAIIRTTVMVSGAVTQPTDLELTPQVRDKLWTAVEAFTGMPFKPDVKNNLVNGPEDWKPTAVPDSAGIYIPLIAKNLEKQYGTKVWQDYLKKPKPDPQAGGPVTAGGVQFSTSIPEEDRKYFLDWMKQLGGGDGKPGDANTITADVIAKLREIDKNPLRDKIIEALKTKGVGGTPQALDSALLASVINSVETQKAQADLGIKPDSGATAYKPLFEEPVRGNIVNRGGLNYVGQETDFYFEATNNRDAFAVPEIYVKWVLVKKDAPTTHLKDGNTRHLELKTPDYFAFEWKEIGIYIVHAFVTHTFYQPSHFQIDVEVKTEAQRTQELNDPAFAGLKGATTFETGDTGWPFDVSWFNTIFGSTKEEYGKKSWGTTPEGFQRLSYEDRVKFLATDKQRLEDMIKAHTKDHSLTGEPTDARWRDMVAYAKDKLKELNETQGSLDMENKAKNTFFEARGTFLSRKNGIPDKALKLVASAGKTGTTIETIVHDFTQLYEPMNYTFSASGTSFEKSIEATFVDLCKSYPPGRISALFEMLDDNVQPLKKTVGYEFDTGSAWKDVKSVAYNEHVMLAVNIVGAATMIFLPFTAPVLFPLLGAYNSIDTIDNMAQLEAKGNLTWQSGASGVAQIGLNFLPYVGEMKAVAQFGKVARYTLEGVTIMGMGAIMTADAVEQIRNIRNQQVTEIAKLDDQIREKERTNPSDPALPGMRADLANKIKEAQAVSDHVFNELAKSGAIMLVQMAALKGMEANMGAKSIGAMRKEGIFTPDTGEPHYDPKTGMIKGDEKKLAALDPEKLAKLKEAYAMDMAAKQAELANVLGTDKVQVTRGGDKVAITPEGDGFKVEIPKDKAIKDAIDEAWNYRKTNDPKAPADRPPPVVADVKPTLDPAELVHGKNIAVGTRVQSEGEAQAILGKLAAGDRSAFQALGMEAPPKDFDLRSVEWGIGQMPDGSFIIIRGEPGAVNWSGFGGVRAVAHSHPLTPQKLLKGNVTFADLVKGGGANELNKVNVFPSAADVEFCARNGLGEHTVQTPYVSKGGGAIGNPTPGAHEPLVQIKILQPERVGFWAGNPDIGVYKSKMVATDTSGKVLWSGEVHTINHEAIGSLVMFEEPPAGLMTKPVAGVDMPHPAGTSTKGGTGGKPIPPADQLKIFQSAEGHTTRELKPYQMTPEAEERVKLAAREAADKAYQEAVDKGQDATKARKAASDAAKLAARTTANTEGVTAAKAKAEEKISTGDVFDLSKLPPEAKKQLENFDLGTSGDAAKRLSSQLEGKTALDQQALLDNEVTAGNATKQTTKIPDPTDATKTKTQDQLVYRFTDGTLIRIKPMGDKFNPGQPMFSVEVNQVPSSTPKVGQAGVAFKVDSKGRPIPKGPDEIKNPYNKGTQQVQNKTFAQAVLDAGHRMGTP